MDPGPKTSPFPLTVLYHTFKKNAIPFIEKFIPFVLWDFHPITVYAPTRDFIRESYHRPSFRVKFILFSLKRDDSLFLTICPDPFGQFQHGKDESIFGCQCCQHGVPLPNPHGTSDLLGNDDPTQVVDASYDSGSFHDNGVLSLVKYIAYANGSTEGFFANGAGRGVAYRRKMRCMGII